MTLFDTYFFVDWSASNKPTRLKPKKDTIWLGELVRGSALAERYHRTRSACVDDLLGRLRALTADGLRVLVGFDFAYGYPRGLAEALGLPSSVAPWARTWELLASRIADGANNESNRWRVASELNRALMPAARLVGPFWGCPPGAATATLKASKREGELAFPFLSRSGRSLPEWRHAEARARSKNPSVQSTWKLFTSGSVGSQALVGIPRVARIRHDAVLAPFSKVWPFENLTTSGASPRRAPLRRYSSEIWQTFGTANLQRFCVTRK
ncbi:hypothetical protein WMF26_46405 [Sorangium sp. So ce185]|uniref:hypothetical protein n=1 Tax=Sorangium sp. So ce185 TaxID=3133287 RepID=UPI003F5F6397